MAQKDEVFGLNHRQKSFVDEYLSNGMNARQAYLTVYQPDSEMEVVDVNASKLLSNSKVKEYLGVRMGELSQKTSKTREDIVKDLEKVTNKFLEDGKLTPNALKAIELLAKMNGWFTPQQHEVKHMGININYTKPISDDDGPNNI